eukprot:COSAG02_NODE_10132_length_2013_cov_41.850052_2_plen_98_part_00
MAMVLATAEIDQVDQCSALMDSRGLRMASTSPGSTAVVGWGSTAGAGWGSTAGAGWGAASARKKVKGAAAANTMDNPCHLRGAAGPASTRSAAAAAE